MKYFALILFVLMCLAQWLVPAKMIYDSESVISNGTVYKFKTQPIDPSDPFRGKYVVLNYEADNFIVPASANWQQGEVIFVQFEPDSAGFAQVVSLTRDEPESGSYLKTSVNYFNTSPQTRLFFNIPFDRFYLEESKASEAERIYWQAQRDSSQVAYGLVTIGMGQAVLTDVMINDKSVVDIVKELNADNN